MPQADEWKDTAGGFNVLSDKIAQNCKMFKAKTSYCQQPLCFEADQNKKSGKTFKNGHCINEPNDDEHLY